MRTTSKQSVTTSWVGKPIRAVKARVYYASAVVENNTYNIWDTVFMNSENESFPIGRIVSMWEQAKKKRITIEWLYQSEDVERACEKQLSGDHEEYETGASEPPAKRRKLDEARARSEEVAKGEAVKLYRATMHPKEVFASTHREDHNLSSLQGKAMVTHISKIDDLEEYAKGDAYFFKKHFDLATLEIRDAEYISLSPEEAIESLLEYDAKPQTQTRSSMTPNYIPKVRARSPRESRLSETPLYETSEEGITLKKSYYEERVKARTDLLESPASIEIFPSLWTNMYHIDRTADSQLKELENVLENQCNSLLEHLRGLVAKQEENINTYNLIRTKMAD